MIYARTRTMCQKAYDINYTNKKDRGGGWDILDSTDLGYHSL